jgi:voltage-gated potassium channel
MGEPETPDGLLPGSPRPPAARKALDGQRWRLVLQMDRALETPLALLGFAWLALLIVELVRGQTPWQATATNVIWIVFIVELAVRFGLAPRKLVYLRRNWLTAIALVIPALRFVRWLRALRALRALRGLRLVRILTSVNRGMRSLRRSMARRGLGYVAALTLLVTFAGAAGMYAFERDSGEPGFATYGESLWWTATIMTTLGSQHWPQTPEGRLLTLFLSLYAFAIFGYITAAIASLLVGQDRDRERRTSARERNDLR